MGTAASKAKNKYNKANYTRIQFFLSKEEGKKYREKCEKEGLNYSDIPRNAVIEFIKE